MSVGRWLPSISPPLGSVPTDTLADCAVKCISMEGVPCIAAALVHGVCWLYPHRVPSQYLTLATDSYYIEHPIVIDRV